MQKYFIMIDDKTEETSVNKSFDKMWINKKNKQWQGTVYKHSLKISGKDTDNEGYENSGKKKKKEKKTCWNWIEKWLYTLTLSHERNKNKNKNKHKKKMTNYLEQTNLVNLCLMYNYSVELMAAKCCKR